MGGNHVSHSKRRVKRTFSINLFKRNFYWPEEDRWIHYMSHELIGLSLEELEEYYFKQDPELREVFEELYKEKK